MSSNFVEGSCGSGFSLLKTVAAENAEFFKKAKSEEGLQLGEILAGLVCSLDPLEKLVDSVSSHVDRFNFSSEVPGNGYLSWVNNTEKLVSRTTTLLQQIGQSRSSYFFKRRYYLKEVTAHSEALSSMSAAMKQLLTMISWSQEGHLFAPDDYTSEQLITSHYSPFSQYCFYGRCLAFQFSESMAVILKALCILMASFSEVYYNNGKIIDSIIRGSRYFVDPDLRGKRIVDVSRYASAGFCKNFWYLGETELMHRLPSIVSSPLEVIKTIMIETNHLVIRNNYDKDVVVPIPSAHIGKAAIQARLLSASMRIGMVENSSSLSCYKFPSNTLVFHCHGGGFVAQSSKSHEMYLREWAVGLDVPIISIDYSLAPEAPYPRALEEIFYAYCWALSNPHTLGTTAEIIILVGDSAGGNLNLSLTLMCLEFGVRQPDGIFAAYAPVIVNPVPSPSRLLTFIDPMLPFGFVLGCCKAYASSPEVYLHSQVHERKLNRHLWKKSGEVEEAIDEITNLTEEMIDKTIEHSDPGVKEEKVRDDVLQEKEAGPSWFGTPTTPNPQSPRRISDWFTSFLSKCTSFSTTSSVSQQEIVEMEKEMAEEEHLPCPLDMLRVDFSNDPFINPFYASESLLANFPPTYLLTTEMDPFLDDSIEFAKKLNKLGIQVKLDILPGLSHGFLNFSLLSDEAMKGTKVCMKRIQELIDMRATAGDEHLTTAEEC